MRLCSVEGCDRPHNAKGYCPMHYGRWRAHGDPLVTVQIFKHPDEATRKAKVREAQRRWRLANPDKMAAARAEWEKANPERRREHRRARKKLDPAANRAYVKRRYAIKKQLTVVHFTAEQLRQRLAFYGNLCWMCGVAADQIEHVKPLSKGGAHILCNLRPACGPCNSKKGNQWPYPSSSHGREAANIAA